MKDEELVELLAPIVADLGLECWGVEYRPSAGNSLLRVYIDVPDRPVTVDDCEAASREISAALDVDDPIKGHYTLEVSSPGLDRPLFTPAQFQRFVGERVKVAVNLPVGGRRRFQGVLAAAGDEAIVLAVDGGEATIAYSNIQGARLMPDYVALGLAPADKPKGSGKAPTKAKKA
ncbi:ribosome maturation factor RimP [Dokdonella koreensis]|uniref:Ribosome maturation factor RimP n=1 Tax=Dokdonella koreensis DS-123 TaxID=1300342 RepID=A0A160DT81_9GAMM|nr:ribosome maturation factor RimP [Dokdonella koreensis]ANB17384.1 Ribosome maturation factor RimP [Dokdonella koreensis DS-123]